MATIGEQIRRLRKKKGVSQGEVSKATGVPRSTISKLETNMPEFVTSTEKLKRLAEYFGAPIIVEP